MNKIVGVIGGMGPAATVQYMARVQALTPTKREQDHLRLIVDCNPHVPDRNDAAGGNGASPAEVLAGMARGLERAGAQMLAMPCNAAHAYAADIQAAVSIPFLNLIDAVCDQAAASALTVGVLAADACLEAGLYQEGLARRGVDALIGGASDQAAFMELLYRIKSGDVRAEVRTRMRELAENLIERGAEAIVAGCTEVPLVLGPADVPVPFVDSIEILAARTVAAAKEK
jgi:aspartate racemase